MSRERVLATAGLWGAVLTAVILAMSFLLRLGTRIEADVAFSVLPADLEQWARLAHRIAAMAVGILAALALVAIATERPVRRSRISPIVCVVALTLLLSAIGRYTPGYRFDLVTVLNVVGGIGLAAAFWWLRLSTPSTRRPDVAASAALGLLLVLATLGACADAYAMRGERAFVPPHLVFAPVFVVTALFAAWRQRHRFVLAGTLAVLILVQVVLGFVLVAGPDMRAMAPAWTHGMIAMAVAFLLVSLAVGRPARMPAGDQPGLPSALRSH
jgi:heme A synthase